MIIMLTNDDGCEAPGLRSAFDALCDRGDIYVVAPSTQRSACSHTITLGRPITVEPREHDRFGTLYAVDGTPADCVRLGVAALVERPVDLVVSGINAGANAGVDTYYSGTIAGAREAAILGMRAIAVSQALRADVTPDWSAAREVTAALIKELLEEPLPGPGFWSINLPAPIPADALDHIHRVPIAAHPMPMKFDQSERHDGRMEFAYGASYWLREVSAPSDYSVIRDGGISITAIPLFGRF